MEYVISALDLIDSLVSYGEDSQINIYQFIEEILRFTVKLDYPMLNLSYEYKEKVYDQFIKMANRGGKMDVLQLCQELGAETIEIDQNPDFAITFIGAFIIFINLRRENKEKHEVPNGIKKKLKTLM